ncbi:Gp37-like protein [Rhodococcus erythropolis]
MSVFMPGYARPNTTDQVGFDIEFGSPDALSWRPLGSYMPGTTFEFHWFLPTFATINIMSDHPAAAYLRRCKRRVIHIRTEVNGIPWTGRVFGAKAVGPPGRMTVQLTCISNMMWLMRGLAWVNNTLPPEIQFNITGKQDIDWGPPDQVFKKYVAKVFTRLRAPVYGALPIRKTSPELPDLDDIDTLDDLLNIVHESPDEMIVLSARFPQLDELFKQTVETHEIGMSIDLWTPADEKPSPHVFNTHTLSMLQSVFDYTSDNFLNFTNPGNVLGLTNPSEWGKMQRAGYVFNTHAKRDRRELQWRTDSGQIVWIESGEETATLTRVVIGGKAPEILNQVIEWGANFALQLILNAILPGLGLGNIIGDLFDNVFFAFQQFWDPELEDEMGEHGRGEGFGDNTAAYSLDGWANGLAALKAGGGSEYIKFKVVSGGADNRGLTFGADVEVIDGVEVSFPRRFKVGDIMTFYDDGVTVEQYVSSVKIVDNLDGHMVHEITLGDALPVKDAWEQVYSRIQKFAGIFRAIANST